MAQLSSEEKISRIEQAPKEVQVMVAKAFIRDDIDDESVQYLFNSDTIGELNDPEQELKIENINAEEPEGIGASNFSMRATKPRNNKNYITTGADGWNTCIKGSPMDYEANVLANCVGYASGRFNEIINEARGTTGCTYTTLNCNAVNFKERAEAAGLQTGSIPKRGAIICWGKDGGAGHVAIVEKVDSDNQVYTSESGWGSSVMFWNQERTNNNGRWGMASAYYFRCFIYLPDDVQRIIDEDEPQPASVEDFNIGDKVIIDGPLYVNAYATSAAGSVSNTVTEIVLKEEGAPHPYNTTGYLGWMDASSIKKYETPVNPVPAPVVNEVAKGVDISVWQEGLSIDNVKNSGYGFAIIRAGYTSQSDGVTRNKDSQFENFYAQAKNIGLPVGAYWYSCANTAEKGRAEAEYMYENCLKGKQFEYPIYIDVEDAWQLEDKIGTTNAIIAFCKYMQEQGYYPGVYANGNWFTNYIDLAQIEEYSKWLAVWNSNKPDYGFVYDVWQNSNEGIVQSMTIDTDISYRDFPTYMRENKINGYQEQPMPTPEPEPTPQPEPEPPQPTLAVGDTVKIIGTGNGSCYGTSNTAYGIGWTRQILRIWDDKPYPYQVGNNSGTTGFYPESSLQKI